MQRIVSFLPAATEMICALGLADRLVGITHECDYPPEIRRKPVVVRGAIDMKGLSLREIDVAVTERIGSGASLYQVDETLLQELKPELIVTQNLCQVCAPSGNEVSQVLKALSPKPEILWMTPKSLEEVFQNIHDLGQATGRSEQAGRLIAERRARLAAVAKKTRGQKSHPPVFCMEWIDPLYCGGHWMAEMVELAGGIDRLSRKGSDSVRIPWEDVAQWAPEVLIVSPCGFNLDQVILQAPQLLRYKGFSDLPAVQKKQVYAVDANSYFARPGPRLVEGTELLAHLIHPELFSWSGPEDAFRRLEFS